MPDNLLSYLLVTFLICFAIQIVGGTFAIWRKTDKVTDISYGLTFVLLSAINFLRQPNMSLLQILVNVVIIVWGIRIAGYLFIRILKTKTDKRFDGIRENPKKFIGFWALQAISVPIILLPVTVASAQGAGSSLGIVQAIGIAIAVVGILIESVADMQKFKYKNNPKHADHWVDVGLWKYARHPNYFGEMLVWWGLLIAIPVTVPIVSFGIALLGPVYITFLLLFVSGIPPLEKRYSEKFKGNAEYQKYVASTSLLVPISSIQIGN